MAPDDTFTATSGHGSRGGKRELVIAALLTNRTHADAAELCGISLRTLQRWLKEDAFNSAFQAAKSDLVNATTGRLRASGVEAVETLRVVAADAECPPQARVSASRAILEFMFAAVELEDVLVRLEKLEQERGGDDE
jgi:hypothetical protein